MSKSLTIVCTLLAMALFAVVPAAQAEMTLVLQGPTVTEDTYTNVIGNYEGYNYGGDDDMKSEGTVKPVFLKFDLSSLTGVPGVDVLTATLTLNYTYCNSSSATQWKAHQVNSTSAWTEGTAESLNYTSSDGATRLWRDSIQPHKVTGWTQDGTTNCWVADIGEDIAAHPDDSTKLLVQGSKLQAEGAGLTGFDMKYGVAVNSTRYDSLTELNAASPITGSYKLGYYWDDANNKLYATRGDPAAVPYEAWYVPATAAWNPTDDSTLKTPDTLFAGNSARVGDTSSGYITFDLTTMVENWTEGDTPDTNNGFRITGVVSNRLATYCTSEYGTTEAEMLLQPKLTVTYTPEPATMGLLGLGFAGMAVLRRRRRK